MSASFGVEGSGSVVQAERLMTLSVEESNNNRSFNEGVQRKKEF